MVSAPWLNYPYRRGTLQTRASNHIYQYLSLIAKKLRHSYLPLPIAIGGRYHYPSDGQVAPYEGWPQTLR